MNFDIVNKTQTLFEEIALLYTAFGRNPHDGLSLLRGDEHAIVDLSIKYASVDMPSLPQLPASIVFERLRALGQTSPNVWQWLFRDRIEVLQRELTAFKSEVSMLETNGKALKFLDHYKSTLQMVIEALTDFAGKVPADFSDLDANTDWLNLFNGLNGYVTHAIRIAKLYESVLTIYVTSSEERTTESESSFKLSDRTGARSDLIRILNVLYDLRLVTEQNGDLPTKKVFVQRVGGLLGIDEKSYHQVLQQAHRQSETVNLRVFSEMKEIVKKQLDNKQNDRRQ
ncbi:hypothetical protein J2I47_19275 [Fibrella sp. HMF5335]|uniref:Uncharacterized protein n=1 Tax=Fibrella rubiginis TaxID=2817060 RepID=A0A939GI26_9BACT|nr:hypothetical protein [Fibrella rubiginis]MBO0938701.1 hypothetical protein [Fibrella rubiginis]